MLLVQLPDLFFHQGGLNATRKHQAKQALTAVYSLPPYPILYTGKLSFLLVLNIQKPHINKLTATLLHFFHREIKLIPS